MSEAPAAAEAEPKKKKGKLPVIIALVALLGGGGFFVMKSKGAKKGKPPVKLGPISDIKDEFLVNLRDSSGNYLRVAVSLQFADGTKAEEVEKSMPAIQDAINMRLRAKSLSDVRTLDGTRELKREIAADINAVLDDGTKKDDAAKTPDKPEEGKTEGDKKDDGKKDDAPKDSGDPIPEGWDSAKGPVLKVLFRSFAWQ